MEKDIRTYLVEKFRDGQKLTSSEINTIFTIESSENQLISDVFYKRMDIAFDKLRVKRSQGSGDLVGSTLPVREGLSYATACLYLDSHNYELLCKISTYGKNKSNPVFLSGYLLLKDYFKNYNKEVYSFVNRLVNSDDCQELYYDLKDTKSRLNTLNDKNKEIVCYFNKLVHKNDKKRKML